MDDFKLNEKVFDDLTSKKHIILKINIDTRGNKWYIIDSEYLEGYRHPWELTKVESFCDSMLSKEVVSVNRLDYTVKLIPNKDSYPFLLELHYAKRIPSISYTYGLFLKEDLVGVVCYGTPPSPSLRRGLAGKENIQNILELNRLCLLNNLKNEASILVSKSLKLLPKYKIIISFADSFQDHIGYVYQACNFLYYGLSAKRTDWALKSKPHLHGTTIADMSRGKKNRAEYMRSLYKDDFYLKERSRKHRYIYVTGKGKLKDKLIKDIKYKKQNYPKRKK